MTAAMLPVEPVELVFATRNAGKLGELRALVAGLPITLRTLDEVGFTGEVVEDAGTFEGNACKKALEVARSTGRLTLADDSGLEVDALGGLPGVGSARFGGEPRSDERNRQQLLAALEGVALPRPARFRSVIVLARADGVLALAQGTCEGEILDAPRGTSGFGYDPLFYVPSLGRTMAELAMDEKNRISHRGQAMRRMADIVRHALASAGGLAYMKVKL